MLTRIDGSVRSFRVGSWPIHWKPYFTYRLKVIEQLSERCHAQETELSRLNSFYGERRKYEARIARLEAEIDELHKALGSSVDSAKEREGAIRDMKATLTGVARTRHGRRSIGAMS